MKKALIYTWLYVSCYTVIVGAVPVLLLAHLADSLWHWVCDVYDLHRHFQDKIAP